MTVCPRCKCEDSDEGKSWDVVPKTGKGKAMHVTMYKCRTCGNKFRKATKLTVSSPTKLSGVMRILVTGEINDNGSITTSKLLEYIKVHDGLLDVEQSAKDLEISIDEVKGALSALQEEGKIKIETTVGSSAIETPIAPITPSQPLPSLPTNITDIKGSVDIIDSSQRESLFQRLKRSLGF